VLEFLSLFVVGMAAVEDSWFSSAKQGRQDDLQELVSQISSVNIQDSPLGNSALHYSSQSGHIDCIKVLLKAGANVNLQNKTGETPLHKASWRGNLEAIQLLVEHGANVTIRNKQGQTPKDVAKNGQTVELLKPTERLWQDSDDEDENSNKKKSSQTKNDESEEDSD